MKKVLSSIIFVFVFIGCSYINNYDSKQFETLDKKFNAAFYSKLKLETFNGSINSSTHKGDSIILTFKPWATGVDSADARKHISDIKINIVEDTATGILKVDIDVDQKLVHPRDYGCNVTIILPDTIALDLSSSNGRLNAFGHQQGLKLHASNGDIGIRNTAGATKLSTSNGSISVDMHSGNIEANTSNGRIDAKVVMPTKHGVCTFKSSNGRISLAVPDTVSASVHLKTLSGGMEVAKKLGISIQNSDDNELNGYMGSTQNAGKIELETSNGHITLKSLE